jgi:integrase
LEAANLEGDNDARLARDIFIFSFYAGGMRIGDALTFQRDNIVGDRVRYSMMKTGTQIDLALPPAALALNRPYLEASTPFLFPLLEKGDDKDGVYLRKRIAVHSANLNEAIKDACRLAGVENPEAVSMHVSRHSFADFARRKSGNIYAVSKALGHTTLSVTQAYLKSFDRDAVDELTDTLWK